MVTIKGTVLRGMNIAGRLFDTPTANLAIAHPHHLEPGVYAAYAHLDGETLPSAVYISLEGKCEVHIFDFAQDIVGMTLGVDVLERVSDVVAWESQEQMRGKIVEDLQKVRAALQGS